MNANKNDILRVALYIRVSTEEQALRGYSLQAQEDALVEYAAANKLKVVGIYRDEGHSARKPALKRKVMLQLLEDVKAGNVDRVLFIKLDRWFRNVREYHSVQTILDKHNVTWEAILEDYNTATADGRLKVNIMLSVAENEADRTSERIKFVFNSKVSKRETMLTNRTAPYGYRIEKIDGARRLVKDPETQHIVEDFFKTAMAYSIRYAADTMNEKYGLNRVYKLWWETTKKEIYTGVYRGVADYCEPYITKEQFDELNNKNKIIKRAQNDRVYLFSGLLKCPKCGRRLGGKYCTSGYNQTDYLYYRCTATLVGMCDYRTVTEKRIEDYLLDNVRKELENFVITAEATPASTKAPQGKSDTEKLTEKLRRLNVAYFAGNLTDEDYTAQTQKIKEQIAAAQKEEEAAGKPVDLEALKAFLETDFETTYQTLSKMDKRRLWRAVIDEIVLDGKDVVDIKFKA